MNTKQLRNQFQNLTGPSIACLFALVKASTHAAGWIRPLGALMLLSTLLLAGTNAIGQSNTVNLALDMAIDNPTPAIGNVVTYTVTVSNSGTTTATGVVVSESIATGYSTYMSSTASVGTFNYTASSGTGSWSVGSIAPNASVTLMIQARVNEEGVAFSAAEVSAANETDVNSTPNNASLAEDDYDNACFSVPISWYAGAEYTVDKPAGFTAVTWLADGQPVSSTTTNASVDGSGNLVIKGPGTFAFQVMMNGCPAGNCCNIMVVPGATATLGNYVFEDKNVNGLQDSNDTGIPNVLVTLYQNGTAVMTTTTDASGMYSFTGLTPGSSNSYAVGFATPTGYTATAPLSGTDRTLDSDAGADPITGHSLAVTLTAGERNLSVDAGYYRSATIGDYVFDDADRNGVQNGGDTPLANVVVSLYRNGTLVSTTTTDVTGHYSFTGLTPGTSVSYSVGFASPTNYTYTSPLSGTDRTMDSDAGSDPVTGRTLSFTLSSGESNTAIDAGFVQQTASLGNYVFEDRNANGVQDGGIDAPIVGVVVSLLQNGTAVLTTTTDAAGLYSFTGLTPNTPYSVSFAAPGGYRGTLANVGSDDNVDSDGDALTGLTGTYSLSANQINNSVDMGYFRPATIGDYVFEDRDRNGVQSAGDTGIPGVLVTLYQNGSAVMSTTTDPSGMYSFTGLTPGTSLSYSVGFGRPSGFDATSVAVGGNPAIDSDADPVTGRTLSFTLSSGQSNTAIDAGFMRQTATLGNYVFEDKNVNGIQDAGDVPLSGVLVSLYESGTVVRTMTSDVAGLYSFTGLTPGLSYSVGFGTRAGYQHTLANVGSDDGVDSDAGPDGLTGEYRLSANETNNTVDAGYFRSATIGDYVFDDADRNGVQSVGDSPLSGVLVTLYQNGSAVMTTTTDASGLYSFTGLTPGVSISYSVGFTTPANYSATTPLAGTNAALDSDAGSDPATGRTLSFTLGSGQSNTAIDAGFIRQTASLGNYVFEDRNANGVQDGGIDAPIVGVVVSLLQNGTAVLTTTTDAAGLYSFTGLTPNTPYSVSFAAPGGYRGTLANVGSDDNVDSDGDALTGLTGTYSLSANQINNSVDMGYFRPATIGDYVFEDRDRNGVQSNGDVPISGVVVSLYQNGTVAATTTTDVTGHYSFTGLTPGTSISYSVGFATPASYTATNPLSGTDRTADSDAGADPATGRSLSFTLSSGESNTTIDAGYVLPLATLGNYVFEDKNVNGLQDSNDTGIPNVLVTLYQNGTAVMTTTTDASGMYSFTGLTPGSSNSYAVGFATPTGYTATAPLSGTDRTLDSDAGADPITGHSLAVTLTAGERNLSVDAGYYRSATIGDYVFDDADRNGVQNGGDTPLANVVVSLYRNGTLVSTTTTDVTGHYSFTGLTPGTSVSYSVGFASPTNYTYTSPLSGTDRTMDSDAGSDPVTGRTLAFTLSSGESNTTVDAGFFRQQSGLGNYVFEDKNADGIQNAGDLPLKGVLVTLYQNGTAISTMTTDVNGAYSFTGLASGSDNVYRIGFATPTGFKATIPNAGTDDALDSDLIPATGQTDAYTLAAGTYNPTVDAGFVRSATIGDYAFIDANRNGIQDGGDLPLGGVVVTLYQNGTATMTTTTDASGLYSFTGLTPGATNNYSVGFSAPGGYTATAPLSGTDRTLDSDAGADPATGRSLAVTLTSGESNTTIDAGYIQQMASIGNYVFEDQNQNGVRDSTDPLISGVRVTLYRNGIAVATTTTDVTGHYSFTGLTPGTSVSYTVGFRPPVGYNATGMQIGGDDDIDSDIDPITDQTRSVTLTAGEYNPRLNAGFVREASIGDYVFNDLDNSNTQTTGDQPIPNVAVTLYRNGTAVASTTTDITGHYSFTGLTPGMSNSYIVGFTTPTGYTAVTPLVGGDPALDSDADPATGRTASYTLSSGQNLTTVDAGFRGNVGSIGDYVWFDNNNDGSQGDPVSEPGLSGVTVQLYTAGNTTTPLATTTTNGAGHYLFRNLPSGRYQVKFTAPIGTVFATKNRVNVDGEEDSDVGIDGFTDVIVIDVTQPESSTARNNWDIDAGIVPYGSIGNYVWVDANKDGIQNDGPNAGIADVTVQLFGKGDLANPLSETVTDATGKYVFENLLSGDYVVKFTAPTGYTLTLREAGPDRALDSDAGPDGFSRIVSIDASRPLGDVNRDNLTIDAGIYSTTCTAPIALIAGASSSICTGGITTVSASASGVGVIRWYTQGVSGSSSFTTASAQSYTVSPTATAVYFAQAQTAAGCLSDFVSLTVTVNARPATPSIAREKTICLTEKADLMALQPTSPPRSGGTYEWHTASSETSPVVANQTAVSAGTYYLFERSPAGCYSQPGVLTVMQIDCNCPTIATVSTTLTSGTACAGDQLALIATIGGSATSVSWATSNSATAGTLANANSLTASYLPSADDIRAGQVEFIVTTNDPDGSGSCSAGQSRVVVMLGTRPAPVRDVSVEAQNATICPGQSTRLIGFATNARIRWTNKATGAVVGIVDGNTLSVSPTQTTTYVAEAISANGCTSLSAVEVIVRVGMCQEALADLAVEKSVVSSGSYRVGGVVSYAIKAKNNGPVSATGVTVNETLPAGLAFVDATPATDYNASTGLWTVGTLANGEERSLIVRARIIGSGSLVNSVRITGRNDNVSLPQNNTATVTITLDDCNTPPPTIACAVTSLCGETESTALTARDCAGEVRWSNGMVGNNIIVTPGVTTTYTARCVVGSCTSSVSNSIRVTVTAIPAPVIVANTEQTCVGGVVSLTASGCPDGTVYWSNNAIGSVISATISAETRFTAQCRISNCYSPSGEITIRTGDLPKPTVVCSTTVICPGETVTLTAENCLGTPQWSTGETTSSIVVRPTVGNSSYSLVCRNGVCTSPRSNDYTIRVIPISTPTVVASTTSVCVGGVVSLTATGCPDATVYWSNNAVGSVISATMTANESFYAYCRVRDCTSDPSRAVAIAVGRAAAPTIRAIPNTAICAGESVTLTVTDGCTNGIVKWSNTNLTGNTIVVTPGSSTTYTATCQTDNCESGRSNEVRVILKTSGTAPTIAASAASVCTGSSVTLTASGCSGGTVVWSNQLTGQSVSVVPKAGEVFYAICRQDGACGSPRSNTISINLTTTPPPTIVCSTSVICPGEYVDLAIQNCAGVPLWSTGPQDDGKTTIRVTPTQTTSYSAICQQGSGSTICLSAPSQLYTIVVMPVPTLTIAASSTAISEGESVTLTATNECPGTITWSTNQTGSSIVVTPTAAVTYYTATCRFRSCTTDPSIRITIRFRSPSNCDAKAGTLTAPAAEVCVSGQSTATLTATDNGGRVVPTGFATLYVLSKGTTQVLVKTSSVASFTVPATAADRYTIHTLVYDPTTLNPATIQLGATTASDLLTSIRNNNTCADLDLTGASTTVRYTNPPVIAGERALYRCLGDVVSLSATGCDNGKLTWSTGAVGSVVSLTVVRDMQLSATCELNGCVSAGSEMVSVNVVSPKRPTVGSDKLTVCAGEPVVLTAQGCENGTYLWTTGATTTSLTVTPQLSMTYAAKCVLGSCASEWSPVVSLTVGTPASPMIVANGVQNGTVSSCYDTPVTLTARGCGNGAYTIWSNNQVGNSITVTPAVSATYTAQCCTSNNCKSATSNAIVVIVLPKVPQPPTRNLTNTCPLASVNLTNGTGAVATTGGTFEFYTSADLKAESRLASSNVTVSGTYYVVEKTNGGCYSLPSAIQVQIQPCGDVTPCASNTITVNAGEDAAICAAKTYKLKGSTTGQNVTTQWTTSGTGTFDDAFSPTALYTASATDVQTGQVTLTLTARTSNPQCPALNDVMVLTLSGPAAQPVITYNGSTKLCAGDSVVLMAPTGFSGYRWNTSASTQQITVASSGTYTVQVVDANGCSSVASVPVSVTVAAPVPAPLVSNVRNTCPATTADLTKALSLSTAGSTYEYHLGATATSPLVVNPAAVSAGTYYIVERTASQCVSQPARVVASVFECNTNSPTADLVMTKLASTTRPKVGESLTYTLKVTNKGPNKAYNVDIRDVIPAGLNLVVGSTPISYTVANGAILKRFDSLAVGASDSIVFVARLGKKGNVVNTASITYSDATDPDVRNNTSSVTVADSSASRPGIIGLAKSIVGSPAMVTDSTVGVRYTFTLTNFGDEDLTSVGLTDNLGAVFGVGNLRSVQLDRTDLGTTLNFNDTYTGVGSDTQLLATGTKLAAGQTITFGMSVTAQVSQGYSYTFSNTARATASNSTTTVADDSVDGLDADPDKDGNPTNNSGSSTFYLTVPGGKTAQLGVSMAVAGIEKQADNSYNVTYKVYVRNFGTTTLTNVSLIDSVGRSFPAPVTFRIVSMPTANAGSELVVSGDFNGTTAPYYLYAGASRLAAGKQDTITYVLNVMPAANGIYYSQVYATAKPEGSNQIVNDRSNAGATVVVLDNSRTVVRFDRPTTLLGLAKAVGTPVRVGDNVWDVPYTIKVSNVGSTSLNHVQVVDDLSKVFDRGAQVVSVSVTADAGLKLNSGYTGVGLLTSMLDTTASTLPVRATRNIYLTARVDVSKSTSLTFTNLAIGSGMNGLVSASDTSNTGSDVDPDNDLDPRNNNRGTFVVLSAVPGAPYIGVAMAVQDTARQANGSYNVTYRIVVKNYGTANMNRVALTDTLSNVFHQRVGASYTVLSMPTASAGSRLKLNPGYNGNTDPWLVQGDSISTLAAGVADTLLVRINVVSSGTTAGFFNSAYATARAGTETVRDMSTNGLNPDPNGNNNPTELTEREATPLFLPLSLETMFIPEGFSPNGDGINDRFVIRGTAGLTVSLEVFNRWGHRVYFSDNYENDWDGTANTGVMIGTGNGNALPDGTYYYVVRLSDGREYVRYMTLQR